MDKALEKKSKWKRWLLAPGIIAVVFSGYALSRSFGTRVLRLDAARVQVAEVMYGEFDEFIAVNGVVEPRKTTIVVALEGGIVESKYVEDGAKVEKGQDLFKLANEDLQMEAMNRETALLDQLNNLRNTQINLEQSNYNYRQQLIELENAFLKSEMMMKANTSLAEDSLIAKTEYESLLLEHSSLKGRYQLLKETTKSNSRFKEFQAKQLDFSSSLIRRSLENLKSSLEKLVLKAPASGLLTGMDIEIGQSITKGQKVAEVDLLQGYLLNASVDELYIAKMHTGLKAQIEFGGKSYTLKVEKVYPQVNNGQFRVDLVFDNESPQGLKYGQTLGVKLSLGEPAKSLLLKRGGFYQKTGGAWVFVLKDNAANKRTTHFGRQNPDYYEVLSGLEAGEKVIVSSYELFGDIDQIILEEDE